MEALVYNGSGECEWKENPKSIIRNYKDATIRMTKTIVCEIDIHITNGDVPEVMENIIIGHEGVVVTEEVGPSVSILNVGNSALISYQILR